MSRIERLQVMEKKLNPWFHRSKIKRIWTLINKLTDRNWAKLKPKEDHVYSETAQQMKDNGWEILADDPKFGIYARYPLQGRQYYGKRT